MRSLIIAREYGRVVTDWCHAYLTWHFLDESAPRGVGRDAVRRRFAAYFKVHQRLERATDRLSQVHRVIQDEVDLGDAFREVVGRNTLLDRLVRTVDKMFIWRGIVAAQEECAEFDAIGLHNSEVDILDEAKACGLINESVKMWRE